MNEAYGEFLQYYHRQAQTDRSFADFETSLLKIMRKQVDSLGLSENPLLENSWQSFHANYISGKTKLESFVVGNMAIKEKLQYVANQQTR